MSWGLLYELTAWHPGIHAAIYVIVAATSEDKGAIFTWVNIGATRRRRKLVQDLSTLVEVE